MTDATVKPKRAWSWLSFIVGFAGALVILGGIWIGVAVHQADVDARNAAYTKCLANLGFVQGDPGINLDELVVAADVCSKQTGIGN